MSSYLAKLGGPSAFGGAGTAYHGPPDAPVEVVRTDIDCQKTYMNVIFKYVKGLGLDYFVFLQFLFWQVLSSFQWLHLSIWLFRQVYPVDG